jgi:hypothetical protein
MPASADSIRVRAGLLSYQKTILPEVILRAPFLASRQRTLKRASVILAKTRRAVTVRGQQEGFALL